jgi:DedD protein
VREVRAKLEKAGLKTYTQLAETKEGKRTRVRMGPYTNKAEAEKALAKVKGLQLQATLLTF